ncbi:MAG: hypothetical protein QXF12_07955 [Candidatus Aenigmatarchaeota archaeon]
MENYREHQELQKEYDIHIDLETRACIGENDMIIEKELYNRLELNNEELKYILKHSNSLESAAQIINMLWIKTADEPLTKTILDLIIVKLRNLQNK